jgi:putative membrane protein
MLYRSLFRRVLAVAGCGVMALVAAPAAAQASTSALNAQDTAYLKGAHQSNLAEIAAGKLAQAKGSSAAVKDLGAMLVSDHTKLDAALMKVAMAAKVSLPAAPNAEQRAMQAKLTVASGADFDAMYVSGQIVGHAKTMALGDKEAANGQDAAVKKAAAAAAPVVASHHHKFMAQAEQMGLPGTIDAGRTGTVATTAGSSGSGWVGLLTAGIVLTGAGLVVLRRRRVV